MLQILVDSGVARNCVRVYSRLLQMLLQVPSFFFCLFVLLCFFLVRRGNLFFGAHMHRFDEFVSSPSVSCDRLASTDKLSNYLPSPFSFGSRVNSLDSRKWRACSLALTDGSSYLGGKGEIKFVFPRSV